MIGAMIIMAKPIIHFVGEAPVATKIDDPKPRPKPAAKPVPRPAPRPTAKPAPQMNRTAAVMLARNNTWVMDGAGGTTIPVTISNLVYRFEAGRSYVPIMLPPLPTLPALQSITFDNLPIHSITDIGNLVMYRSQLHAITFIRCPSLVIEDLTWFVPMTTTMPRTYQVYITVDSCRLHSLRGMEQFQQAFSLNVQKNGIDLAREISYIEQSSRKPNGLRSNISLGGNNVSGKPFSRNGLMGISMALARIREAMATPRPMAKPTPRPAARPQKTQKPPYKRL